MEGEKEPGRKRNRCDDCDAKQLQLINCIIAIYIYVDMWVAEAMDVYIYIHYMQLPGGEFAVQRNRARAFFP